MTDKIEVRAMRVEQPGSAFYVFQFNGKQLKDLVSVARRYDDPKKGIQRVLKKSRLRQIKQFIDSASAMFPNSIIVNIVDTGARFVPDKNDGNLGVLQFPKRESVMWIADGQHRTFGFEESEKDFPLIVAAMINSDLETCARLFYKINKEQKKVNPNLGYDLLGLIPEEDEEDTIYHEIVVSLNNDMDSPFRDKIKMVDVGPGIIGQATLIYQIKKLVKSQGSLFMRNGGVDKRALMRVLKDYFGVLAELQRDAWSNPEYVLTKTLGTGALLRLLPDVIRTSVMNYKRLDEDTFRKVLEPLSDFNFSGEEVGHYSGEKGQQQLADEIAATLDLVGIGQLTAA